MSFRRGAAVIFHMWAAVFWGAAGLTVGPGHSEACCVRSNWHYDRAEALLEWSEADIGD